MSKQKNFPPEAVALLGTMSDPKLAKKLGIHGASVGKIRLSHGIKAWRVRLTEQRWTPESVALLGNLPDSEIATKLGVCVALVSRARVERGIAPYLSHKRWSEQEVALLGTASDLEVATTLDLSVWKVEWKRRKLGKVPDAELAQAIGVSVYTVMKKRRKLKIPSFEQPKASKVYERFSELGTKSDTKIAQELGVSTRSVARVREANGIPASNKRRSWNEEELELLGQYSDAAVAKLTGRSVCSVHVERTSRKIPGFAPGDAARLRQVANKVEIVGQR